jgi:hypothetical protein
MMVAALLTDGGEIPDCMLLTTPRRGRCALIAGGGWRALYWGLGWDGQAVRRVVADELGAVIMAVEKEAELRVLGWVQGTGFSGVASSSFEGVSMARVLPGTLAWAVEGRAERWGDIRLARDRAAKMETTKWVDPSAQCLLWFFQSNSNLPRFKIHLPGLKKFQVKYGFEEFGIRNNFPYRNVLIFEMDFELKFKKASRVWIWIEFDEIWLEPQELMQFGQALMFSLGWQIILWK